MKQVIEGQIIYAGLIVAEAYILGCFCAGFHVLDHIIVIVIRTDRDGLGEIAQSRDQGD